jgi:3-methylcrotonyl-CoA carboxylase alpha subunit
MFRKALIANRGEIACRIIRTMRRMGVATVAVFSDADANALHVEMADEAWRLGEAPARASYLSIEKILDVARRGGAEAVHPGYGFLAESAEFSQRCADAGLAFVGPSPATMRAIGDKAAAKRLMSEIGVPTLPGFHGEAQDARLFARVARDIGFPVAAKASAGGGGRGMRVIRRESELPLAMESAAREALAAFGDGRLLIEKYLERPRHVEAQFVADQAGNVAIFAERDCSLQRNHQKIIEETPAPRLPAALRAALHEATVRIVRASGYEGAGTAEFLVDGDDFYFLEVNARLQVEHPVTEMVSGVDLVEWQLRVACGDALPLDQDRIVTRGCAIEARLCAEDPAKGFLPSSGVISHLRLPAESGNLRLEIGVRRGDDISTYYDPLLAKIVAWDETREGAMRRLERALDAVELTGVATNLDFLRLLVRNERIRAGPADVGLAQSLVEGAGSLPEADETLLLAAVAASWRERESAHSAAHDPSSPWSAADGWRLYGEEARKIACRFDDRTLECRITLVDARTFRMEMARGASQVAATRREDRLALNIDGVRREVGIIANPGGWTVIAAGRNHILEWVEPLAPPHRPAASDAPFSAPVPARVTRVLVKRGDRIEKGAPLVMLEAMKMEIPIKAPQEGVIQEVFCGEGQSVREGEELLAWRATNDAA